MSAVAPWKETHAAWMDGVSEAEALRQRRARSWARFEAAGLPSPKLEAWKYTSVRQMMKTAFVHAGEVQVDTIGDRLDAHRIAGALELVIVDGHVRPELSRLAGLDDLPPGVALRPLAESLATADEALLTHLGTVAEEEGRAFAALNGAFLQDGAWLDIGRGADVAPVVHLLVVSTGDGAPTVGHPRHVLVARSGSRATVAQTHVALGAQPSLTNEVVEIVVEANAELDVQILGTGGAQAHVVQAVDARLDRDARLRLHLSWLGGGLVRSEVGVVLAGEGAEVHLDGLYVLGDRDHVDNHTVVDHAVAHCISREFYKGVLGGRSKGVFDGTVIVRQDAQRTDSSQDNRNLLLTDTATANAKPRLEIYADDVKCSHGTTVGQLDRQQLDYLRSRGIPEDQARAILTAAFVADRVDRVRHAGLQQRLRERVDARLQAVEDARETA